MANAPPITEYASPPSARAKFPPILWWFMADAILFIGAIGYLMYIYEGLGPTQEPPREKVAIVELWMFAAQALFMFLLGWAAYGWWRSLRAG